MHGRIAFDDSGAIPRPAASHVQVLFEGSPKELQAGGRLLPVANASASSPGPSARRLVDGGEWSITDFFGGFESHVYVL